MESHLAEVYATHLTNLILGEQGLHIHQSPKKPQDDPKFWSIYSKACTSEDSSDEETPEGVSNKVAEAEKKIKVTAKKGAKSKKVEEVEEDTSDEDEFEGLDD